MQAFVSRYLFQLALIIECYYEKIQIKLKINKNS